MKAVLSSLIAFVMAGLPPRTPLAKAVVFVLAFKFAAIVAMQVYLLSGDGPPPADQTTIARLIGPATPPTHWTKGP
jgi:hypothetical protein